MSLFAGRDYSSNHALVDYRVKQLAYACVEAVHQNRLAILTPLPTPARFAQIAEIQFFRMQELLYLYVRACYVHLLYMAGIKIFIYFLYEITFVSH